MFASWTSDLYCVRKYEVFQNINFALFEVSLRDHSYSSPGVEVTEGLQASITCDVWMHEMDLFFITETQSLEAVVKEEFELSPWNNWPLSSARADEKVVKGGGKEEQSAYEGGEEDGDWKEAKGRCLTVLLIPHTAASASVQLIGIQSREGSMRVSVTRRGSCCLSPAMLNLHCWLGIDWRTSKRDRHTVAGKMNCHLAFLNRLAASNWPLWTMWRDTDWVLPPPPSCLL